MMKQTFCFHLTLQQQHIKVTVNLHYPIPMVSLCECVL